MTHFTIIDYTGWQPYEGLAAGSGRSEKEWLISDDGRIGLFKYPKIDPATNSVTTEHISEHMAAQIGKLVGVKTAQVDLGRRNGRIGSMSYLVKAETENLIEGINFIVGRYPNYNATTMIDETSGSYYSLEMLEETGKWSVENEWIEMLIFDALIGNADRHQSNWAILIEYLGTQEIEDNHICLNFRSKWCPLYDNGSSLCCYVNEKNIDSMFGKDPGPFKALVDTKSKSIIRIDGSKKAKPTHKEMVLYLIKKYPSAKTIAARFIERFTFEEVDKLLDMYTPDMVCVVPWYLSNAVCGKPQVARPWVQQAKYATKWSMFFWQFLRQTDKATTLESRKFKAISPCSPYPKKSDNISLHPVNDSGGNYGRLPRYRPIMDTFCEEALNTEILGIKAESWRYFLQIQTDSVTVNDIKKKLASKFGITDFSDSDRVIELISSVLRELPENLVR